MIAPDDPRHGHARGYYAGCRDACCRRAHALDMKLGRLRKAEGRPRAVPVLGPQRRVMALMALGWTTQDIANAAGMSHRAKVSQILHGQKGRPARWITRTTEAKITAAYELLSMRIPPHTRARARTRTIATRRGYHPPLAWDDIDDPNEQPAATTPVDEDLVDEAVVLRILAGEWRLTATHAERVEVCRRWTGAWNDLARLTGWKVERYNQPLEAVA